MTTPPHNARPLVVAVLSQKGGVGKTTAVLGLAGVAWNREIRTLVIDLDPQANATSALDAGEPWFTSGDVLYDAREGVAREAVVTSGWGEPIDLIAAERALEHRARDVDEASGTRLRRALHGVTNNYGLVLIDCPPSLGELTRNALAAADLALVVTEATGFSRQGALEAITAVEVVRDRLNLGLRCVGVLVSRFDSSSASQRRHLDALRDEHGDRLLPVIVPASDAVQDAQDAGIPLHAWASPGATAVQEAYEDVLDTLLAMPSPTPLGVLR